MTVWPQLRSSRTVRAGRADGRVLRLGLMDTVLADLAVSVVLCFDRPLEEDRLAAGLALALNGCRCSPDGCAPTGARCGRSATTPACRWRSTPWTAPSPRRGDGSWRQEVGADVERLREARQAERTAARWFPSGEARFVAEAADPAERSARFTALWCRSEACVKAYGGRLAQALGVSVAGRLPAAADRPGPARGPVRWGCATCPPPGRTGPPWPPSGRSPRMGPISFTDK
ncbi:4'-phosphopantetheinyl transferase family protein [Kitasatospora sp. NPDC101157]|uniref:4'-phosphopantetheinyl transferase family protein n=1 Tax=Kitasatospora sp. NPDC101157 TaxID=3364098 RepID=UPI0037F77824